MPRRPWCARTTPPRISAWGWRSASWGATRRRGRHISTRAICRRARVRAAAARRRAIIPDHDEELGVHDLKFLRQHRERVEAGIALKGMSVDLQRFYASEERRLAVLHETEQVK